MFLERPVGGGAQDPGCSGGRAAARAVSGQPGVLGELTPCYRLDMFQ